MKEEERSKDRTNIIKKNRERITDEEKGGKEKNA